MWSSPVCVLFKLAAEAVAAVGILALQGDVARSFACFFLYSSNRSAGKAMSRSESSSSPAWKWDALAAVFVEASEVDEGVPCGPVQ